MRLTRDLRAELAAADVHESAGDVAREVTRQKTYEVGDVFGRAPTAEGKHVELLRLVVLR